MKASSSARARFLAMVAAVVFGLAPARWLPGASARFREVLRRDYPNRVDYERMERGYYEPMLDAARRLSAVDAAELRHEGPVFEAGPLALVVNDLREYVLKPNLSAKHFGNRWTTNALGMRDREYPVLKPEGTFRIALVGDSIGSGWGVGDGTGFEPRLEERLDAISRGHGGPAIEILNFAVPGHAPGQRYEHFLRVSQGMGIDLVLYEATLADPGWDERRLRSVLHRGLIDIDRTPQYRELLTRAGAAVGESTGFYKSLLKPYRWEILEHVYRTIASDCRDRGVASIWVLVPRVGKEGESLERGRLIALAYRAGFDAVLDVSEAYEGLDPAGLAIAPSDYHPNAAGHQRLADRLERVLVECPRVSRIWATGHPSKAAENPEGGAP